MSHTRKSITTRKAVKDRLTELSSRSTFITIREAANMLGLAPDTVHHLKGGTHKLTRVRHGRAVRMIRQEVDAHIQQQIKASQRNSIN
jgi:excisionase family DNA binding protein